MDNNLKNFYDNLTLSDKKTREIIDKAVNGKQKKRFAVKSVYVAMAAVITVVFSGTGAYLLISSNTGITPPPLTSSAPVISDAFETEEDVTEDTIAEISAEPVNETRENTDNEITTSNLNTYKSGLKNSSENSLNNIKINNVFLGTDKSNFFETFLNKYLKEFVIETDETISSVKQTVTNQTLDYSETAESGGTTFDLFQVVGDGQVLYLMFEITATDGFVFEENSFYSLFKNSSISFLYQGKEYNGYGFFYDYMDNAYGDNKLFSVISVAINDFLVSAEENNTNHVEGITFSDIDEIKINIENICSYEREIINFEDRYIPVLEGEWSFSFKPDFRNDLKTVIVDNSKIVNKPDNMDIEKIVFSKFGMGVYHNNTEMNDSNITAFSGANLKQCIEYNDGSILALHTAPTHQLMEPYGNYVFFYSHYPIDFENIKSFQFTVSETDPKTFRTSHVKTIVSLES